MITDWYGLPIWLVAVLCVGLPFLIIIIVYNFLDKRRDKIKDIC